MGNNLKHTYVFWVIEVKYEFLDMFWIFLEQSLQYIDKLPHENFNQIVDKYADMNIAPPFREGNGRAMRIWLDCMLRQKLGKVID